jgi:hypothetical protein
VGGPEGPVDLAGDVAPQAATGLLWRVAFGAASFDVGAGGWVVGHANQARKVQGTVQTSITAAVQAVADGVA